MDQTGSDGAVRNRSFGHGIRPDTPDLPLPDVVDGAGWQPGSLDADAGFWLSRADGLATWERHHV